MMERSSAAAARAHHDPERDLRMQFIEMSGQLLLCLVSPEELPPEKLQELGVTEGSLVRVNRQGDVELRRPDRWDLIGGLVGDFAERVKRETGLDWA